MNWKDDYEYYCSRLELIMKRIGFNSHDMIPDMDKIKDKLDELLKLPKEIYSLKTYIEKIIFELDIAKRIISENQLTLNEKSIKIDDQFDSPTFNP